MIGPSTRGPPRVKPYKEPEKNHTDLVQTVDEFFEPLEPNVVDCEVILLRHIVEVIPLDVDGDTSFLGPYKTGRIFDKIQLDVLNRYLSKTSLVLSRVCHPNLHW